MALFVASLLPEIQDVTKKKEMALGVTNAMAYFVVPRSKSGVNWRADAVAAACWSLKPVENCMSWLQWLVKISLNGRSSTCSLPYNAGFWKEATVDLVQEERVE